MSKSRCELRLDPVVHERMKKLADKSGLSMNQLVEGILAWAGANGFPGSPSVDAKQELVKTKPLQQVLWFGHDGLERDESGEVLGPDGSGGQIAFMLDFRATRAMVNGWEVDDVV